MVIEFFLLLGGFTNVFIGDDGVKMEKMGSILSGLKRFDLAPSFFGYCPESQIALREQGLNSEYCSYNKIIPILDFYKDLEKK